MADTRGAKAMSQSTCGLLSCWQREDNARALAIRPIDENLAAMTLDYVAAGGETDTRAIALDRDATVAAFIDSIDLHLKRPLAPPALDRVGEQVLERRCQARGVAPGPRLGEQADAAPHRLRLLATRSTAARSEEPPR